jgi:hypothetical protein
VENTSQLCAEEVSLFSRERRVGINICVQISSEDTLNCTCS